MKSIQEPAVSKQDRSAIKILLIFLVTSLLTTAVIVYFVNLLLRVGS
ncbi:hypothetical protein HRG84_19565 [Flavisolibacter sp. BT320]|nr:hypothetical protein [Flavisolibacter longurius]